MRFLGLLKRNSLAFLLTNGLRITGIVIMILIISAEIVSIVNNIKGYQKALKAQDEFDNPTSDPPEASSRPSETESSLTLTGLPEIPTPSLNIIPKRQFNGETDDDNDNTNSTFTTEPNRYGYFDNTNIPTQLGGIGFAVLQSILNVALLVILVISELSPPKIHKYIDKWFPPLGTSYGVGWLGLLLIYVCTVILSKKVETYSLVTAWIGFVVGIVNVTLGLLFGKKVKRCRSILGFFPESMQPENNNGNGDNYNSSTKVHTIRLGRPPSVHFDSSSLHRYNSTSTSNESSKPPRKIVEIGRPFENLADPVPPYPLKRDRSKSSKTTISSQ